ncbi:uncharacterized protein LOC107422592 [Ziziphus jujuba]|uniref:Uncharacterized protein LOC107422592 n=1 Tax=Ziziphus jujuba TaxID=326968 RepID=A0A6P4AGD8_ZIZJJ|nr:uncharacterized protein LOC107422592 [Ziziphus jujuba]
MAAKSFIASLHYSRSLQTPWLMLPPSKQIEKEGHDPCCFVTFEDEEVNNNVFLNFREEQVCKVNIVLRGFHGCIGSSYGWLILLDKTNKPSLLNPFTRDVIGLPSFNDPIYVSSFAKQNHAKAILLSNPSHTKSFVVVVINNIFKVRFAFLAFYKQGDESWTTSSDHGNGKELNFYLDIICHNGQLYALKNNDDIHG